MFSEEEVKEKRSRFWGRLFRCAVLFGLVLTLLLYSARLMPLTWDEGDAFDRVDLVLNWRNLFGERGTLPEEVSLFSQETINKYWEHTIQREGHPAGYTIINAVGKTFYDAVGSAFGWTYDNDTLFSPKLSYRFGVLCLAALALAAVFYRIEKSYSKSAAIFAVLSILLLPRVFAHWQLAVCDSPLMSAWILCWAFFESALAKKRYAVIWGIFLGLGLSIKFPGWIIPLPFLLWLFWFYRKNLFGNEVRRILFIGIPTALLTFFILNPPLWNDPIEGFKTFLYLNTHRRENFNIPIWLFGQYYNLDRPLPWYNGFLWTVLTVPPCLLILSCFAGRNRRTALLFLNWLVLILIRMIPGIPVHDGVRLFIEAFPFLGIAAGLGAARFFVFPTIYQKKKETDSSDLIPQDNREVRQESEQPDRATRSSMKGNGNSPIKRNGNNRTVFKKEGRSNNSSNSRKETQLSRRSFSIFEKTNRRNLLSIGAVLTILLIYLYSAMNLFIYAPQWLSYFSSVVGGPGKMAEKGTEVTYYWDSFDNDILRAVNTLYKTPEYQGGKILFNSFSQKTIDRYRNWGLLIPEGATTGDGPKNIPDYRLYVVQVRLSGMNILDRNLFMYGKPLLAKTIAVRRSLFSRQPDIVRLLLIYDISEVCRVFNTLGPQEKFQITGRAEELK